MTWQILRVQAPSKPQLVLTVNIQHGSRVSERHSIQIPLEEQHIVANGFVKEEVLEVIWKQYDLIAKELEASGYYLKASEHHALEKEVNTALQNAGIKHQIELVYNSSEGPPQAEIELKNIVYQDTCGVTYTCIRE